MKDKYQFKERNMMPVRCISLRCYPHNQHSTISIDHGYLIDRNSIWIDNDGDAYGQVFSTDGVLCGQYRLKHFTSLA